MSGLRDRPRLLLVVSGALAVGGIVAMAAVAGFGAVGDALSSFHPGWLVLCAGGQLVAYTGYVFAYRAVARLRGGPELSLGLAARLVAAGFGAFALRGGFGLDTRALRGISGQPRRTVTRVLGLGALEWGLLAPAACVCALVLLLGNSDAQRALLWSWVLAVPLGFAIGLWAADPMRVRRLRDRGGWRGGLGQALAGVELLRRLLTEPSRGPAAWLGLATYWAGDIASFYGALRAFDVRLSLGVLILAYATGYAATRRTLPLGGAGVTEVLMVLALHWVGLPLAVAVAPVAVYRIASFALPTAPALASRARLERVLRRGDAVSSLTPATGTGAGR